MLINIRVPPNMGVHFSVVFFCFCLCILLTPSIICSIVSETNCFSFIFAPSMLILIHFADLISLLQLQMEFYKYDWSSLINLIAAVPRPKSSEYIIFE